MQKSYKYNNKQLKNLSKEYNWQSAILSIEIVDTKP